MDQGNVCVEVGMYACEVCDKCWSKKMIMCLYMYPHMSYSRRSLHANTGKHERGLKSI